MKTLYGSVPYRTHTRYIVVLGKSLYQEKYGNFWAAVFIGAQNVGYVLLQSILIGLMFGCAKVALS